MDTHSRNKKESNLLLTVLASPENLNENINNFRIGKELNALMWKGKK